MVVQLDGGEVLRHEPIHIISGSENKCVHVRRADLQLHGACGVLEQSHSLRVAHAFSRGSTDTDDTVANLEK